LPEGSWRISKIANVARRAIEAFDLETQERILTELEGLQTDPFSGDVKRIKGKKDVLRLRSGRFRVYFRIIPLSRSIEILLFDQRGAIKSKNIQRI
jgi:mRNA-degrading endonuclease RelE of RelBE toxin-antitoxin system